jgi:hypothetical protein
MVKKDSTFMISEMGMVFWPGISLDKELVSFMPPKSRSLPF